MKKGLLSLLAVALTIVSCQNYDDQFAELTGLVNTLSTEVSGLSQVKTDLGSVKATVDGLVASIGSIPTTDNSTALTDLLANLVLAQADIDAIEVILAGGVASAADLVAIDTLIDDVQAGVNQLLTKNGSIPGNVVINNSETLASMQETIELGPTSPKAYLVTGFVNVDLTNLTAAEKTATNLLTAKILSVGGAVTVKGAVELGGLSYIAGTYTIIGSIQPLDSTISSLGAAFVLDGKLGDIAYPNLSSVVGNVSISNAVSVTTLDFSAVTTAAGTLDGGTPNYANATSLNLGKFVNTTVRGDKVVTLTLGQTTNAAGLAITAPKATAIDINALTSSAGALSIVSAATTSVIHLDALVSAVGGIVANNNIVDQFHLPALLETKTAAVLIQAKTINLSALKKVGFATTFIDATNVITTNAFVSSTAAIVFTTCDIAHINFPKLVLGSTLTANSSTTQLTVASTGDAGLASIATGVPTAVKVNLTAQTVAIAGAASMNAITTLNVVGKISAAAALNMSLTGVAGQTDALTELTVADLGAVVLGGGAATNVVTLTTAGAIDDLSILTNVDLVSVTIGHGPHSYTGFPAQSVIITGNVNAGFKSVDLGSVVLLDTATITTNTSLAVITAPDVTGTLLTNAVVDLTVDGNSLIATGTTEVPGTLLPAVEQASLTTWKAYILHVQTTIATTDALIDAGAGPLSFDLDYDKNGAAAAGDFVSDYGAGAAGALGGTMDLIVELGYIDHVQPTL